LNLELRGNSGEFKFDSNRCAVVFKSDGKELLRKEYGWQDRKELHFTLEDKWDAGRHGLAFKVEPLTKLEKANGLEVRLLSVTIKGPMEPSHWTRPKNYERFFAKDDPATPAARRAAARKLLGDFARKAFRRPVDDATVERLGALAETVYTAPGKTFEAGVAQGMVAVLASPRFLFREEGAEPAAGSKTHPRVDEYSLASRLSYFLWSSMPDEELFKLAAAGQLRKQLPAQVKRMLNDWHAEAFARNFVGQWLEARDIEGVQIDARSVLAREATPDPDSEKKRARFRELRDKDPDKRTEEEKAEFAKLRETFFRGNRGPAVDLTFDLRQAMRRETEMYFEYVVKQDRPVTELIDSDYTFLNEKLAKHYGLTDVTVSGNDLRRVTLPAGNPRGGILTQGSVLAVTSNPTRTSPVKRGLFILDNILGTPPLPPPPDIPPLEDSAKGARGHTPTLRETLEIHRAKPLCASCHDRMDPLGLAFENFNAMGMWREKEGGAPVDVRGKLVTGEGFVNVTELKHILANRHKMDFYRTLTEKLLTYALGRGLEYYDVETVDRIVDSLDQADGHFSALLSGIIESAPFQKRRMNNVLGEAEPSKAPQRRAALH
ncbi:MAG TPA: DUF1592 domain-containing protein, partial [Verrucomicrobiae bacterium]|nr:DUF1592 domain-containing protein [Verrucomicrobiae bacterium]